jgi:uncharacterized tellurite resistance protein B-like protein
MVEMQLLDLHPDERLALVALSRAIVRADGNVSALEGRAVAQLALALGEETYRHAFAQSIESFGTEAALKRFLETIQRQEARALIFDAVLELAVSDGLSSAEVPLLRWLEATWDILGSTA